jgi:hypothetical protein
MTTIKSLNNQIKNLPLDLKNEIFYFLYPCPYNIVFKKNNRDETMKKINGDYPYSYHCKLNISDKYEVALLDNSTNYYLDGLISPNMLYLFRIPKKNGKHRYYITELIYFDIETENSDYITQYIIQHKFISKYVGKNIDFALLLLYTDKNILNNEINDFFKKMKNIYNINI